MFDSNLLAMLGSQPIWLQVFIGLVLFFIGIPLLVFFVSVSLGTIGDLLSELKVTTSMEKKVEESQALPERNEISDAELFKILCLMNPNKAEADIKSFLKSKARAEKNALKKNPKVLQALERLRNASDNTK